MEINWESIKNFSKEIFSSQDSRYFIFTALKFTIVPIASFIVVFYSLWTILEMNFNFFVANGFTQENEVFYDNLFMDINEYIIYFLVLIVFVFMFGLFISYLALRAFDEIEDHTFDFRENLANELVVSGLNKNKLIYQVSRIFFKYIKVYNKNGKNPFFQLPPQIEKLKAPPLDKVFLFQYSLIVGVICISTSMLIYSFTNELYQEIVRGGLDLLPTNKIVASFLDAQETILINIYMIAIVSNVTAYILISRNIIKAVEGVSFGFARDMIKVTKGQHQVRLKPRCSDPGQEIASIINQVLDEVFPSEKDQRSLNQAVNDTIEEMSTENIPEFNRLEELKDTEELPEDKEYSTIERSESKVLKMLMRGEKYQEIEDHQKMHQSEIIKNKSKLNLEQRLPGSLDTFQVTTPSGVKIKNLDKDTAEKLVNELNQKRILNKEII